MLEHLTPQHEDYSVIRLASVGDSSVGRLLERGISPQSFSEIQERLRELGFVFESEQLIDGVFEPNPSYPTPFRPTRFTSGQKAVFYAALEEETSIEEMKYYQTKEQELSEVEGSSNVSPRYFSVFEIDFGGEVLDLFPLRDSCPELTSSDEGGYQKCRSLADEARSRSIDAFRTPSARRSGGICTPVFARNSLGSTPNLRRNGCFINKEGDIVFESV